MLKRTITTCSIVIAFSVCVAQASAQWAVHALAGSITSVNAAAKTITLDTNDGTPGEFQLPKSTKLNMNFDKDVRADTAAPDKANAKDGEVIVFFFGNGPDKTVVAVESVGAGPFQKQTGTVVKFDKHDRLLTVQTDAGEKTFVIGEKTIVDTPDGVVLGRKFSAERGDHLRLLATSKDGHDQALLIRFDGNPTN